MPAVTTTTTTPATTTTTTSPPAPPSITYFFSGATTINPGDTTYLWGYWSGATATVDNGIGAFPSALAIDISPVITTTYTLTVDNGAGQTVTATVTVTVNQAQTTTTSIGSGTTTTSTTVVPDEPTITYFFSGTNSINPGESTYLWAYYSGSNAVVDNGIGALANYTSLDISPTVTTTYTLTVTNSVGHSVTATTTVVVNNPTNTSTTTTTTLPASTTTTAPPTTTTTAPPDGNAVAIQVQPPSSAVAPLGGTTQISGSGGGAGSISYQWTLDGVDIAGATSSSHNAGVAGVYRLRVTSTLNGRSVSATSNGCTVTINDGTITSQPHDSTITAGDPNYLILQFSVPITYQTDYQWFRDGVAVDGGTNLSISARTAGVYRVRITMTNNGATHVRWSDSATVTVLPAPTITSFAPTAGTIRSGTSATLNAVFADGAGIITPGNIPITSGTGVPANPTSTTTYTLTVTNGAGRTVSRTATVTVTTGTLTASANDTATQHYQGSSSVALADGRVLVFGGVYPVTDGAEIYDPATNRFTSTGSLNQSRGRTSGILLSNGKVLVVGGSYFGSTDWSARSTAELFDPTTGSWTYAGSPLAARRSNVAIRLNDGRVMVAGGLDASGHVMSSVEIYDPATDRFAAAAAMPGPRSEAAAVLLTNGNVLIVGGTAGGPGTDTAFIYDPASDTWRTTTSHMNHARYGAVAVRMNDGRVLIGGGRYTSVAEAHLELFDPATETFVQAVDLPSFSTGRHGLTAHLLANGRVAFFGGNDGYGNDLSEIVVFDPSSSVLTTEAVHLSVERYLASSAMLNDGRVFVIGGNYWNSTNADIFSP